MKSCQLFSMLAAGAISVASAHTATVINFDDAYAANGNSSSPNTFYQAADGVTISGTYAGVIGGIGNGDPGNWSLYGTNGSAFLGTNRGSSTSLTFTFNQAVTNFTIDIGVSASNNTVGLTATGYNNGTATGTPQNFLETSNTATDGTWGTLSYGSTPITSITLLPTSGVNSYFAYGFDNVQFTPAAVPEPATWVALAAGAGLLGAAWRSRSRGGAPAR